MKFQDDIMNMNTYIHTDKPKPICPQFVGVNFENVWSKQAVHITYDTCCLGTNT